MTSKSITSHTLALLSCSIGLTKLVSVFCCAANGATAGSPQQSPVKKSITAFNSAVGSVPAMPWRVMDYTIQQMSLFLPTITASAAAAEHAIVNTSTSGDGSDGISSSNIVQPIRRQRSQGSSSSNSSSSASGNYQSVASIISQFVDPDIVVQVIISQLSIYQQLSNSFGTFQILQDSFPDATLFQRIRSMLLVLQGETLFALASLMAALPVPVSKAYRVYGGVTCLQSMMKLKDVRNSPYHMLRAKDAELAVQRCMLVLYCQEICMEASVVTYKSVLEVMSEMKSILMAFKTMFIWLSRRADAELDGINKPPTSRSNNKFYHGVFRSIGISVICGVPMSSNIENKPAQ